MVTSRAADLSDLHTFNSMWCAWTTGCSCALNSSPPAVHLIIFIIRACCSASVEVVLSSSLTLIPCLQMQMDKLIRACHAFMPQFCVLLSSC